MVKINVWVLGIMDILGKVNSFKLVFIFYI